jgi:hypothetical protein
MFRVGAEDFQMLRGAGLAIAWIAGIVFIVAIASIGANLFGHPSGPSGPCAIEFFTDC